MDHIEGWVGVDEGPCREPEKGAHQLVLESDKHMKNDQEKKPRHFTRKITLPHNLKVVPMK